MFFVRLFVVLGGAMAVCVWESVKRKSKGKEKKKRNHQETTNEKKQETAINGREEFPLSQEPNHLLSCCLHARTSR
jgi:flagellar biosynthesis component FlhA